MRTSEINIDYELLQKIMKKLGKSVSLAHRQSMMEELEANYKMSVNFFNNNYGKTNWLKK